MSSKQDRQGARTPANLEQKYSFGRVFSRQEKENARQNEAMNQQNLTLNQFISFATLAIEKLQKDMTTANNSIATLADKDKELAESDTALQNQIKKYWQTVYPVGAIYLSLMGTNPETLFGGTWTQIKDRFLLGAGDLYTAGSTGGEAFHTLTVDEIPSHSHGVKLDSAATASGTNYARIASDGTATNNLLSETGGSKPHNNMPPFHTVYVWRRTA